MNLDLTLYVITDSTYHTIDTLLHTIESACLCGATLIQLREKECSSIDYLTIAKKVKQITDQYDIPLIIDDRVDIALACDAAGVHVGASDLPVAICRKLLGPNKIIGATAKTLDAAKQAFADGANYLGTGAIYPTTTHVTTKITSVETLNEICNAVPIPVAAIGGLNENNIDILANSSISGIAVVSAIMKADNPEKATKNLKNKVLSLLRKE